MIHKANRQPARSAGLGSNDRRKSWSAPHYVPATVKVKMSCALRQECWVRGLAKIQQFCFLKNLKVVEIDMRCQRTQDEDFLIVITEIIWLIH